MRMYKVITNQNKAFYGTPKEIVYRMMKSDFLSSGKGDYMESVRKRLSMFGIKIKKTKSNQYKKFLDELLRVKLIKINGLC